jgi:hypothetical protein
MNRLWALLVMMAALFLMVAAAPAMASEDYFTTDFLYPVQPLPFHPYIFYNATFQIPGQGITGTSVNSKYGIDYSPLKRLDFFFVATSFNADLKRTNRYKFSMDSSNWGFKVAVLPQEKNWCGISAGANFEQSATGPIYLNGFDLLASSLHEDGRYYFILGTKELKKNFWINAGAKRGTVKIGRLREQYAGNWAVGADWQLNDKFQLSGNLKYVYLEHYPDNWNPSLRLTYKPCDPVYMQAQLGYYSTGLHSVQPVLEQFIPTSLMQRFGEKGQLYWGAEFSVQF